MNRITRIVALAFVVSLLLGVAAPVLATEAPPEETTETTAPIVGADEPAVVVPPSDAKEADQPWTARFVYPLLGALTVLIIGGYAIGYNRTIRRRYKVVA